MRHAMKLLGGAAIATIGMLVGSGTAQTGAGAPARYAMDVGTVTGFTAANPMAMMRGGGNAVSHELTLRLGSSQAPTGGAPQADHFLPAGMGLGPSVPLETPRASSGSSAPGQFERPKGRLLLYWGCGAHAPAGQPVVIDFAKVAAGQFPPDLFSTSVPVETGPTQGNSRTFGHWPNDLRGNNRRLDAGASLLGEHRVAGNYSPEIKFALNQDFLAPLHANAVDAPTGGTAMSWNAVAGATGYYAWAMGGRDMGQRGGDVIWWTSAGAKEFGGGFGDWLAPATVQRLIGQKLVMPPSHTSCTIPAEVKQSGQMLMTFLTAYGPEANFAYPPRPRDPKVAWHPDWTARVRYRSTTTLMAGMPGMGAMGAMGGDEDRGNEDRDRPKPKPCKPSIGGMLGGMLGKKTC